MATRTVSDLKSELSEAVKNSRSVGGHQLGIVQLLSDNGIDASKYRTSRSVDDIMADLDCRIADIVKQADLSKYQTQKVRAVFSLLYSTCIRLTRADNISTLTFAVDRSLSLSI